MQCDVESAQWAKRLGDLGLFLQNWSVSCKLGYFAIDDLGMLFPVFFDAL